MNGEWLRTPMSGGRADSGCLVEAGERNFILGAFASLIVALALAMNPQILEACDPVAVRRCAPVMRELRPQYSDDSLVERVLMQMTQGYRFVAAEEEGRVVAVAGFRVLENLAWGRFLYVDDLVSSEAERGAGHGSALIDWLVNEARRLGCDQFHLDSGVQRFGAHRFYLHKGMDINCHHFGMVL